MITNGYIIGFCLCLNSFSTMLLQFILFLFLFSVESFGYVVNTDSSKVAGSGWEHVFAQNKSSVIPLYYYGDKSYFFGVHAKATYMQALEFCDNLHMKLLSVRSPEENQRIHKYIRNTNLGNEYWTSASKLLDGKNWIWMSYGESVEYTNWAPGLDYDEHALCLQLERKDEALYWKHRHCAATMFFICERYTNLETDSNANAIVEPKGQVTRWMNLLEHVSPNIGLLEYGNKKYFFSSKLKTNYMQAIQFCKLIKMELVTITSQEENERIRKYIRDTSGDEYWWTSGTKVLDGKTWVWLSRGTQVDYTNWLPGQPDEASQYCLQLVHQKDKGLFWNDDYCSNKYSIICERSSSDPTDGYEQGHSNTNTNVVLHTAPKIDIRLPTAAEDRNWQQNMQKTKSGSIVYSYVEGKKYHLEVDHVGTHWQAARFCEYHNMQLVAIRDKKESELVRRLLADSTVSGPYWTSGKEQAGTWVWSTSGEQMSFVNWNKNRPNLGGTEEICIEVDEIGKWSDQICTEKRYFICEEPEPLQVYSNPSNPSTSQCVASAPPVVKVYVSNNVITADGSSTVAEKFFSSEDAKVASDGGYHVEVQNKIGTFSPTGTENNVAPYNPPYFQPDQEFK